jgi:hypothetical protein
MNKTHFFRVAIIIAALLIVVSSLTACAKVISTKEEVVQVKIVDEYYKAAWIQPFRAGKVTSFIHHPARYVITVEYNGQTYDINDREAYNLYKTSIGEYTEGFLITTTYDDGTVKYDVTALRS